MADEAGEPSFRPLPSARLDGHLTASRGCGGSTRPCDPREFVEGLPASCHRFRANEVRLLLSVIAYNLGNLLRRLVLPLAIQSWFLTSLQQRRFQRPAGASAACAVLYPPAGREPLDAPPVWADPPAHRATRVASHLIERTAHGGSETRSGAIPAGVSLRAVLRGGISGEERAAIPKRTPVIDSAWAARQVGERAARFAA